MRYWGALPLGLLLVAGCLGSSQAPPTGSLGSASAPSASASPFPLMAQGCREAGGHSMYNLKDFRPLIPEPWVATDVTDDIGEPLVLSYGAPNLGQGVGGIYHAALLCDSWTFGGEEREDLQMGYVAVRVERPWFDPGGADRHFLVGVLAAHDEDVRDALHTLGIHVTEATVSIGPPGPLLRAVVETGDHGTYDGQWLPKAASDAPARTTRLWMLQHAPDPDGGYRPVALDMATSASSHGIAELSQGWFLHSGTDDHAPLPAAGGNVAGVSFEGFERSLALGPAIEGVLLKEAWQH